MNLTRGLALFLTFSLAALRGEVSRAAGGTALPEARLTAITSRMDATRAFLVIEASQPVPYVTTRPDALTIVLDFRNVAADRVTSIAHPDEKGPIAHVSVEATESMGSPVSRVRITLAQPVQHHVRSERNTVVVGLERPSGTTVPYVMSPVTRQAANNAGIDMPSVDPIATSGSRALPGARLRPSPRVTRLSRRRTPRRSCYGRRLRPHRVSRSPSREAAASMPVTPSASTFSRPTFAPSCACSPRSAASIS